MVRKGNRDFGHRDIQPSVDIFDGDFVRGAELRTKIQSELGQLSVATLEKIVSLIDETSAVSNSAGLPSNVVSLDSRRNR